MRFPEGNENTLRTGKWGTAGPCGFDEVPGDDQGIAPGKAAAIFSGRKDFFYGAVVVRMTLPASCWYPMMKAGRAGTFDSILVYLGTNRKYEFEKWYDDE